MSDQRTPVPEENPISDPVDEAAARWAVLLADRDLTEQEQTLFTDWVIDPQHEAAFAAYVDVAFRIKALPPEMQRRLAAGTAQRALNPAQIWARKPWVRGLAAAAAIAVLVIGWTVIRDARGLHRPYVTRTGETANVVLADGSTAHLNTQTVLQWIGGPCDRRVVLLQGEVLFEIRHDARCPFRVVLGNSEIEVTGTRFDAYQRRDGEIIVTVLEGSVHIEPRGGGSAEPKWKRDIRANQQFSFGPTGPLSDVHPTDAADAVKWREEKLEFDNEPLAHVVSELQRYTDRKLRIADDRLLPVHVTGELSTRDIRAALARLERGAPIAVESLGDAFVLVYREESQPNTKEKTGQRP